jgi:Citrate transporter
LPIVQRISAGRFESTLQKIGKICGRMYRFIPWLFFARSRIDTSGCLEKCQKKDYCGNLIIMKELIAAVIIGAILGGIAIGRFPLFRMNRATIALIGSLLLIIIGAITLEQAYSAIDMNTILLLFSMMIINAYLQFAGFFALVLQTLHQWPHLRFSELWGSDPHSTLTPTVPSH